ncbi:MAG TPA: transporter substrate-binding protein, partial [Paracoccaceae bacterium]|nr:transporter substrate-binding protein [Paracoccaceae bacterium]
MARTTRRSFLRNAAALGAAGALPFPSAALAQDGKILVGGLHDLSGPLDFAGIPMDQILTLAVEEINASGGLLGRELEAVTYDPQSNMSLYSQYATQLALQDKVSVVHGGITSASRE